MISRTYDAYQVAQAAKCFLKTEEKVDPIDWIADPENIALINDRGDMALFERGIKHVYTGHYFFKSRGRKAIESATAFLDELFNSCYNIKVLTGLVPLGHLGARWLSRQVGFKSYGIEYINNKPYEMFIITKKEFDNK